MHLIKCGDVDFKAIIKLSRSALNLADSVSFVAAEAEEGVVLDDEFVALEGGEAGTADVAAEDDDE